jgi:hypothetical protein
MGRTPKVVISTLLIAGGVVAAVWFLRGQGLDSAEKWTSLIGAFVSGGTGIAGLVLTIRQPPARSNGRPGRISRTGDAKAIGAGSEAITGAVGQAAGTSVRRTGRAEARDGGRAVSGEDRRP